MKRTALLALVMLTGTLLLHAQSPGVYLPVYPTRADQMFRMPKNFERNRFEFYFPKGNRMTLYFIQVDQVQKVPDLDSLFQATWRMLEPLSDSFSKTLVNRRIDINFGPADQRIRMLEFQPVGSSFQISGSDTTQLKLEQDTLNIRINPLPAANKKEISYPIYISLLLNNITDITTLKKEDLQWAMDTLKADLGKNLYAPPQKTTYSRFYAAYNIGLRRKFSPSKGIMGFRKTSTWVPYVQVGFQYVRGTWAPSAGVGMEYSWRREELQTTYLRLFWEPFFFFSRNSDKSTDMDRADFITASFGNRTIRAAGSRDLRWAVNFSASYALRTKGGWLEDHTIKFSLPGLETRNLMVHPEFYFNDLLKNFSPSLKLTLNLE